MTDDDYLPSSSEWVSDHVQRYLATDGEDGYEFQKGAKVIILTTTGRRTGRPRKTPLIRIADGDRYLVVASKGGAPTHPHWYLNLVEHPEVTIQDRAEVRDYRARAASGQEKQELWPKVVAEWPDY
ncbi:MAG TPA: nitroreductase family deazaflavin-dependent oxidoreductase, partial [Nitriliruptorales bacterium]